MIAWCGSRRDGLSWLYNKLHASDDINDCAMIDLDTVDRLCSLAPRRLILSVDYRVDYPLEIIRHVERHWAEIPLAIAAGTWLDGSRRTGLGTTSKLCLPWYRWWDGWHQWLGYAHAGRTTSIANSGEFQLLDKWPRITAALDAQALPSSSFSQRGLIISNCQESTRGWRCSLNSAVAPVQLTGHQCRNWLRSANFVPDWILWDDSAQDSFNGHKVSEESLKFLNDAREVFTNALIVVATSIPRWSDWQMWVDAGADELFVKPSFGRPLGTLLNDRLARAESTQH